MSWLCFNISWHVREILNLIIAPCEYHHVQVLQCSVCKWTNFNVSLITERPSFPAIYLKTVWAFWKEWNYREFLSRPYILRYLHLLSVCHPSDFILSLLPKALDCFTSCLPKPEMRLAAAQAIGALINISREQTQYFCLTYKPVIEVHQESIKVGRISLKKKLKDSASLERYEGLPNEVVRSTWSCKRMCKKFIHYSVSIQSLQIFFVWNVAWVVDVEMAKCINFVKCVPHIDFCIKLFQK